MARSISIIWHDEADQLDAQYKAEKDPQRRVRLHALWLVRLGHSMKAVAPLVGIHYRTIQQWISWYRAGGLTEVLGHRHGGHAGRRSWLSAAEESQLKTRAEAGQVRSIWDGVEWAQSHCGVAYTYWGMRQVFARLGLKKKGPRPRSPKASQADQVAWKKGDSRSNYRPEVVWMASDFSGAMKCAWG